MMDKDKLQHHLVSNTTRLYCVLDGASVPDLPKRLYQSQATSHCLFEGDLEPAMLHVAPFLVLLSPDNSITDWVFSNGLGKNWGIFIHSRTSLIDMEKHFSSLVNVYDERANSMIFRYYDPRVVRKYLPTCTARELEVFFGRTDAVFAENDDGESLNSFRVENNQLVQTVLE
ncbi:MAG: DUF4123 domain-containing protein [Acidobacteriota bacterium]